MARLVEGGICWHVGASVGAHWELLGIYLGYSKATAYGTVPKSFRKRGVRPRQGKKENVNLHQPEWLKLKAHYHMLR